MSGCVSANEGAAKIYYFVVFALTVLITWILRDYAEDGLKHISELKTCFSQQADGQQGVCTGKGAVLRVSFGNFIFFAGHFLILLRCRHKADCRRFLHTGCLTLQTAAWAGIIGSTFAMPNSVFYGWGQAARVLGAIFLVVQAILVLDFVFVINEYLLDKRACRFILVLSSATLLLSSIAFIGVAYYKYAPHSSCSLNVAFISLVLVVSIFCIALSVSPFRIQTAGLFTASVITTYCIFLLWGALSSEPEEYRCVAHRHSSQSKIIQVVGFVVALVSVVLATFFASTEASNFSTGSEKKDGDLSYPPDFFHFIYMLASAYVAMLFLGWSLQDVPGKLSVDKGWISFWFHFASCWLSFILYIWILIAPKMLKSRDF